MTEFILHCCSRYGSPRFSVPLIWEEMDEHGRNCALTVGKVLNLRESHFRVASVVEDVPGKVEITALRQIPLH